MSIIGNIVLSIVFITFLLAPIGVLYLIYKMVCKESPTAHKVEFPKHTGWLIAAGVLAGNLFLFDSFFFDHYLPSLLPGLFLATLAGIVLLSMEKKTRSKLAWAFAATTIASGLSLGLRSSGLIHEINLVLGVLSLLMLFGLRAYSSIKWETLWLIRADWHSLWSMVGHGVELGRMALNQKQNSNKLMRWVKTAIISLVVLAIFISLLAQADPVFAQIVEVVYEKVADRLGLSALLTAGLVFFLGFTVNTKKVTNKSFNLLSVSDLSVSTALLVLVFAGFLFIQGQYLFMGGADFSQFDLTYSEYVRKGFKELLMTVFFGAILSMMLYLKQKEHKGNLLLKAINIGLIVELFAMLGSALKRNIMYIDAYSLTRMRVIGLVILAWLAAFLVGLVVINLSKKSKEWWLYAGMGLASIAAVLSLNVMNVDGIIAHAEPAEDQRMDLFYISSLSLDAAPAWSTVIEEAANTYNGLYQKSNLNDTERMQLAETSVALMRLTEQVEMAQEDGENTLHFNLGRNRALAHFDANASLFEGTLSCLNQEIRDYQITHQFSLQDEINSRIHDYEYPLTNIGYRSYYHENLDSIVNKELWDEDHKYTSFSQLLKDKEALAEFKARHTPDACPL